MSLGLAYADSCLWALYHRYMAASSAPKGRTTSIPKSVLSVVIQDFGIVPVVSMHG